jgi:predicted patatin/cPLA2 family phospholipase
MSKEETGLVLEGGGFRGIYTAAVLDVFLREKLFFNYVLGVSAGAAYGVSYVSRQYERNLAVNRYVGDIRYCGWRNYFRNGSYFNWDFVYREIPEKLIPFSFETFMRSGTRMRVVVTNCLSGKAEYPDLNNTSNDRFRELLTATSSLPFISRMIEIDGNYYMDGGIADAIPVQQAFNDNMDRVVVILTRHEGYRKKESRATDILSVVYRKYPNMVKSFLERAVRYNKTLDKIEQLEREGKVFIIRPQSPLEVARMENDPVKLRKVYDEAVLQMGNVIPRLREWLNPV